MNASLKIAIKIGKRRAEMLHTVVEVAIPYIFTQKFE
jgi:hypothetical protein